MGKGRGFLSPGRRLFFGLSDRSARTAKDLASYLGARGGGSLAALNFPLLFPPTLLSIDPLAKSPQQGGYPVVLRGFNFSPTGVSVKFGGVLGTVVSNTSTTIYCTSPAHAVGVVSVQVVNADGQTSTLPNSFTYPDWGMAVDASTISLYRFDGDGTDAADTRGLPNVVNVISFPAGKLNQGLQCGTAVADGALWGGTNSNFNTPEPQLRTGPWTVEMWIHLPASTAGWTSSGTFFGAGQRNPGVNDKTLSIGMIAGTTNLFVQWDTAPDTPQTLTFVGALTLNAWNFIALTKSGSSYSLYINGVFFQTQINATSPENLSASPNPIWVFGMNQNVNASAARGIIVDDTRISNVVRSSLEIAFDNANMPP